MLLPFPTKCFHDLYQLSVPQVKGSSSSTALHGIYFQNFQGLILYHFKKNQTKLSFFRHMLKFFIYALEFTYWENGHVLSL